MTRASSAGCSSKLAVVSRVLAEASIRRSAMRGISMLFAAAASLQAADISAALDPLTGDEIFSRLIEHNRQRERLLRGYSVQRAYSATNKSGKLYAAEEVRMTYAAPDEKTFITLSARGSRLVRNLVFSRLMQTEA